MSMIRLVAQCMAKLEKEAPETCGFSSSVGSLRVTCIHACAGGRISENLGANERVFGGAASSPRDILSGLVRPPHEFRVRPQSCAVPLLYRGQMLKRQAALILQACAAYPRCVLQ